MTALRKCALCSYEDSPPYVAAMAMGVLLVVSSPHGCRSFWWTCAYENRWLNAHFVPSRWGDHLRTQPTHAPERYRDKERHRKLEPADDKHGPISRGATAAVDRPRR